MISPSSSHDGGPRPPYAFATHLLGALGPVKRKHQQTQREVEALAAMVHSRAGAAEELAAQLEKMAHAYDSATATTKSAAGIGIGGGITSLSLLRLKSPFAAGLRGDESTTQAAPASAAASSSSAVATEGLVEMSTSLGEALQSYKADLLKKASHRRQLAQSLLAEVHEPLDTLAQMLAAEGLEMEEETRARARELRSLTKRYEDAHKHWEQASQQAEVLCRQAHELGVGKPTPDVERVAALYAQMKQQGSTNASASVAPRSPVGTGAAGMARREELLASPAAQRLASLSNTFIHQVSRARADPTSWLLPGSTTSSSASASSPSPAPTSTTVADAQTLAAHAQEQLEQAELCRLACRDAYLELEAGAAAAAHGVQLFLNRFQQLQEGCVDEVSTLLRKAIVFESCCLANEQDEAQRSFKILESVDKDRDLEVFLTAHTHCVEPPGQVLEQPGAHEITERVLCSLGLPPVPLPPPPPVGLTPAPVCTVGGAGAGGSAAAAVVLRPADLPNLSAPAPNVVPARLVLRLLRGGSAASPSPPPLPSPPSLALKLPAPVQAKGEGPSPLLELHSPTVAGPATAGPRITAGLPTSARSPPTAVVRRSPALPAMQALSDEEDEDDEDEDEEEEDEDDEGFVGKPATAAVVAHPQPVAPPTRSLKEVVQRRHEKQRASGSVSPLLVDLEEFPTETGGKEFAL